MFDILENDFKIKAFKQRETYISTINHDLKIPALAQIRALELLASENLGVLNSEQKEIINLTLESCKAMHEMMSAILASYKYENKDIALNLEVVELMKIIEESLTKENLNSNKKIIRINSEEKIYNLFADKIQLKKAFENLINFCYDSASMDSEICCNINKLSNNAFISISFSNPFMGKEKFENMFNKYTTSAEKLDKVGCSLRLYLAKQIILAHHGTFFVGYKDSKCICNMLLPCLDDALCSHSFG